MTNLFTLLGNLTYEMTEIKKEMATKGRNTKAYKELKVKYETKKNEWNKLLNSK